MEVGVVAWNEWLLAGMNALEARSRHLKRLPVDMNKYWDEVLEPNRK